MSAKSLQKHLSIHEESERRAYSKWLNKFLSDDPICVNYLPIDPATDDLYGKVQDGVLLCKMLNKTISHALDERVICTDKGLLEDNYAKKMDNLSLMINAARCKGADMSSIDINEIYNGDKFTIIDTLWQIIRIGLYSKINIYHHPEMLCLKLPRESIEDFKFLSPHDMIKRYVNLHLHKSKFRYFFNDFEDDFHNCLVYAHLTYRCAPVSLRNQMVPPQIIGDEICVETRARAIIQNLNVLDSDSFLTVDDFVNGYKRKSSTCKLHVCTMMRLFHLFNGDMELNNPLHRTKLYGSAGECLEEFTYRNFINSFNVYPFSNHLLADMRNGWIISQMLEVLSPGITSGSRFILEFDMNRYYAQRVHNNMKILDLLPKLHISCEGLNREKLASGDRENILSILMYIMRCYFCQDSYNPELILEWINCQLQINHKKFRVHSLADKTLLNPKLLAILLDSKSPGIVDKTLISSHKDKLLSFRYLISVAHKIGIPIYTMPELFVSGKAVNLVSIALATILMF